MTKRDNRYDRWRACNTNLSDLEAFKVYGAFIQNNYNYTYSAIRRHLRFIAISLGLDTNIVLDLIDRSKTDYPVKNGQGRQRGDV